MKKTKWNPRGIDITINDMHQIAAFHRIVKNYIKMKNILNVPQGYLTTKIKRQWKKDIS